MYIRLYIWFYIHITRNIYIYTYMYLYIYTRVYIYIYTYTIIHTYIYILLCVYIQMYIHIIYTIILYMIYMLIGYITTCLFAGYLRLSIIMCVFMSLFVPRNCEHVLKLCLQTCVEQLWPFYQFFKIGWTKFTMTKHVKKNIFHYP